MPLRDISETGGSARTEVEKGECEGGKVTESQAGTRSST